MCVYLPRAQCDQADVISERALLNLVDELGQLGVCAAAVVNLKTCFPTPYYDHTRLKTRPIKPMGSGAFTLVMCSSTSSSPTSSSSAQYLGREINSGLLFAVICH